VSGCSAPWSTTADVATLATLLLTGCATTASPELAGTEPETAERDTDVVEDADGAQHTEGEQATTGDAAADVDEASAEDELDVRPGDAQAVVGHPGGGRAAGGRPARTVRRHLRGPADAEVSWDAVSPWQEGEQHPPVVYLWFNDGAYVVSTFSVGGSVRTHHRPVGDPPSSSLTRMLTALDVARSTSTVRTNSTIRRRGATPGS
jgi:hypothetical protein